MLRGRLAVDERMKIDSALVRKLREERAWSQEHLASVSGVSLRTIQRVEAEGTASLETRMALAAAFNG
jgi:predicted transcriptional regulator